jgi:hypothetical protein
MAGMAASHQHGENGSGENGMKKRKRNSVMAWQRQHRAESYSENNENMKIIEEK